MHSVYWIHDENETDFLSEGYIGISNNPERRFAEHRDKYGSVKEVLFTFENRTDAENKEKELRPAWNIGKNVAPGGQAGNRPFGIHTSGWKHDPSVYDDRRKALQGNDYGKYRAEKCVWNGISFDRKHDAYDYIANHHNVTRRTVQNWFSRGGMFFE